MADYTQMWSDLGLDLKAHDALLTLPAEPVSEFNAGGWAWE